MIKVNYAILASVLKGRQHPKIAAVWKLAPQAFNGLVGGWLPLGFSIKGSLDIFRMRTFKGRLIVERQIREAGTVTEWRKV